MWRKAAAPKYHILFEKNSVFQNIIMNGVREHNAAYYVKILAIKSSYNCGLRERMDPLDIIKYKLLPTYDFNSLKKIILILLLDFRAIFEQKYV